MRAKANITKRRDRSGNLVRIACPVVLAVTFGGNRVVLSTGITVAIEDWDKNRRLVGTWNPNAEELNKRIITLLKCVDDTWKVLEGEGGEATPERFREVYYSLRPRLSSGFFQLFYQFMEEKSVRWSRPAYLKARRLFDLLREFESSAGYTLSFSEMNAGFIKGFESFLLSKAYSESTIRRTINILVWYLNWATEQGYNIYRDYHQFYRLLSSSTKKQHKNPVYLSHEELETLFAFPVSLRKAAQARDFFCLSAYTGIPFASLCRLRKEDLSVNSIYISGDRKRQVPLNGNAAAICERYRNRYYRGGLAFPALSPVTYQKWIRKVAAEAGLNRMLLLADAEGNHKQRPLSGLLGASVAVNTFVALALKKGMSTSELTRYTGIDRDVRVAIFRENSEKDVIQGISQSAVPLY